MREIAYDKHMSHDIKLIKHMNQYIRLIIWKLIMCKSK